MVNYKLASWWQVCIKWNFLLIDSQCSQCHHSILWWDTFGGRKLFLRWNGRAVCRSPLGTTLLDGVWVETSKCCVQTAWLHRGSLFQVGVWVCAYVHVCLIHPMLHPGTRQSHSLTLDVHRLGTQGIHFCFKMHAFSLVPMQASHCPVFDHLKKKWTVGRPWNN